MDHPSLPSSSASSIDFEKIHGRLTLAQFINEIESITGARVEILSTGFGRRTLVIYQRNSQPPVIDVNLMVDTAVALREAHSIKIAKAKTAVNLAFGQRRVRPKKAERVGNTIYFSAICNDYEIYSISWNP